MASTRLRCWVESHASMVSGEEAASMRFCGTSKRSDAIPRICSKTLSVNAALHLSLRYGSTQGRRSYFGPDRVPIGIPRHFGVQVQNHVAGKIRVPEHFSWWGETNRSIIAVREWLL